MRTVMIVIFQDTCQNKICLADVNVSTERASKLRIDWMYGSRVLVVDRPLTKVFQSNQQKHKSFVKLPACLIGHFAAHEKPLSWSMILQITKDYNHYRQVQVMIHTQIMFKVCLRNKFQQLEESLSSCVLAWARPKPKSTGHTTSTQELVQRSNNCHNLTAHRKSCLCGTCHMYARETSPSLLQTCSTRRRW